MEGKQESSAIVIKPNLLEAVDAVKKFMESKNILVNEKQMADALNISEEQFYKYLTNEEIVPDDLPVALLSAYNFKIVQLSHIIHRIPLCNTELEDD